MVGGLPVTGKKENVTPGLKEEDVGKLQAGQPNLSLQVDCGTDPPDSHVLALTRQEGD